MNEVRRARRDATPEVSAHHNAQLNYCRINRLCFKKKRGRVQPVNRTPLSPLHYERNRLN